MDRLKNWFKGETVIGIEKSQSHGQIVITHKMSAWDIKNMSKKERKNFVFQFSYLFRFVEVCLHLKSNT